MRELSLNILDITQNSISAEAKNIEISLDEDINGILELIIKDDGWGMDEETLKSVENPFYTTRTTRKIGLGIPLLKLAAEQAGGSIKIISVPKSEQEKTHGTEIKAVFNTKNIDFTPLGDISETMITLLHGNPSIDFEFTHKTPEIEVFLSTKDIKEALGGDVSIAEYEVISWIREYLKEQYSGQ